MHSKRTDASLSCWGRLCWTELCRIWIRSHADVEERVPGSDRFDADLPYLFSSRFVSCMVAACERGKSPFKHWGGCVIGTLLGSRAGNMPLSAVLLHASDCGAKMDYFLSRCHYQAGNYDNRDDFVKLNTLMSKYEVRRLPSKPLWYPSE
eukprot:1190166-Prorocentrum_minimum.AAC.5